MGENYFRIFAVFGVIVLFLGTSMISGLSTVNTAAGDQGQDPMNNPPLDGQGWWNATWEYCRILPINNPSNSYQMKLAIGKHTGGDVDCLGHCRDDFGDIRFLDVDNITVLSYWIENYTLAVQATFWVKLPVDVQTDGAIILYYGNSNASSLSNGTSTFLTFINNTDGWTGDTGILSMIGGRIKVYENSDLGVE